MIGCAKQENASTDALSQEPIKNASVAGCYKGQYDHPSSSEYILPFEAGKSFIVSQGNCGSYITHKPQCRVLSNSGKKVDCGDLRYAYDFNMPIGTNIVAARGGEVVIAIDQFSDTNNVMEETNAISILHNDGTVASYLHLTTGGALVNVGDIVSQGDVIALSGNSGYTENFPHLHFHVLAPPFDECSNGIYSGCKTVPITFRNAKPLEWPLIEKRTYKAVQDFDHKSER